ncbi:hypothetical protein CHUAL_003854 [Chamberlinius hualienensis]
MACYRRWLVQLLQGIGSVVFFIFTVSISPILIFLYLLCWTRAKLTSLICSAKQKSMMTGEDALSGMDVNSNNCIINGMLLTKGRFAVEAMKDLILNKVINAVDSKKKPLFPKFTKCINLHADYLMWSEEANFNVDDHVRPYTGQPPKNEPELKNLIAHLCNNPLPNNKSGWEILLIPLESQFDVPMESNSHIKVPQTCILIRLHHAIADGLSLVRLIVEELADNAGDFKQMLNQLTINLARFLYAFVFGPAIQCRQAVTKDRNLVHGPKLSGMKIFDWTSAIKLSAVKDIKAATSSTVNDVIMSCLAAALRRYFVNQKVEAPDFLHSVIPVNLQGPDDPINMKNNVSFVFAHLPTGDMSSLQRLKTTKSIMDELKRSPDIISNRWFIRHCVNVIPYHIMKWFIDISPVSVIFSNVPGPSDTTRIKGHRINSIVPFLPHRGTIGVGVCVFSYSGDVTVSVSVDTALMNEREQVKMLLDGFIEEMQHLLNAVKV